MTQEVSPGDVIETGRTLHTFSNNTDAVAKFIVFKQVLQGQDQQEVFRTDKILDPRGYKKIIKQAITLKG